MKSISEEIGQLSPERIRQLAKTINKKRSRPSGPVLQRHHGCTEYPLSFGQERLWFLDQLAPGNAAYNWPLAVRLDFDLDPELYRRTLTELARRHETLRTTYHALDTLTVQRIAPPSEVPIQLFDLHDLPLAEAEKQAMEIIGRDARTPFDLTKGPLCRYLLLRLGPSDWIFAGTMHHSIADAWSRKVLIEDIIAISMAFSVGSAPALPELAVQYGDYAIWQREWLQGPDGERLLTYWKHQLQDLPPLDLATDYPRPAVMSFQGKTEFLALSKTLTESLRALSLRENCTLFMTMLAAFAMLLMRYTGHSDLATAIPVANRDRVDLEGLIGFFVNTLVLRVNMAGDLTFRELLARVRTVCIESYSHQEMPFERLVEELHPKRDLGRSPLAQVIFQLEDLPKITGKSRGGKPLDVDAGSAIYDIHVHWYESWDKAVMDRPEGIRGTFTYNSDLFRPETMQRFLGHYRILLESVAANPDVDIREAAMLSEAEHNQLMAWNRTTQEHRGETTLHEQFESWVAQTPQALAVVSLGRSLTYAELNHKANQLARFLRRLRIAPESRVAICMERSVDIIVAIIGVLKAGGAYVPLDTDYPAARLRLMAADAQVRVVLTQETLADKFGLGNEYTLVCLDSGWDFIASEATSNVDNVTAPENAAYVIYTSGSTGTPKGVIIEHRQIMNYLLSVSSRIRFCEGMNYALVSTLAADLGNTVLYPALCLGGTLHVLSREETTHPVELGHYFRRNRIDCMKITPSHLGGLVADDFQTDIIPEKRLVFGGEALRSDFVERLSRAKPGTEIFNHYGPTESTVGASTYEVKEQTVWSMGNSVPIGAPLGNVQAHLLNSNLEPVPVGVPGELYIGGAGVGRGYINQPASTAERFLPDPFSVHLGTRMYKTGDRVRRLADGNIEFLGRFDNQVKIRGYRVELAEVEKALLDHPSVKDAAVVVRGRNGDCELVACVVPRKSFSIAPSASPLENLRTEHTDADNATREGMVRELIRQLRQGLTSTLPHYLVPTSFAILRCLPLTPNGKVDRHALQKTQSEDMVQPATFIPPRDSLELGVARIWEDALNIQHIGMKDNFFELGGHSLLAVRVVARIQKAFGKKIALSALFDRPTIEQTAKVLRSEFKLAHLSPLVPLRETGHLTPLFLVHPAGGGVLPYYELARYMGADRRIYGLQFQGFGEQLESFVPVKEMAAHYIRAIQETLPHGPYLLGGWSLGGVIAFEMAQQLKASGEFVPLVLALDTRAPVPSSRRKSIPDSERSTLTSVARKLELYMGRPFLVGETDLTSLNPDEQVDYLVRQLKAQDLLPEEVDGTWLREFLRVYEANIKSVEAYSPGLYPGALVLFRSKEALPEVEVEYPEVYQDSMLGWGSLCSGEIKICTVPGNHMTMIVSPNVQALTSSMKEVLSNV